MSLLRRHRACLPLVVLALMMQGAPSMAAASTFQASDVGASKPNGTGSIPENRTKKKDEPGGGGVIIMAQSLFNVGIASAGPAGDGYWIVTDGGAVLPTREASDDPLPGWYGDMAQSALNAPIVGIAGHPNGGGYWFVGRDGGVFAYGSAAFFGRPAVNNMVGMAATPSGGGYWLVAADGGVFTYGNAPFKGSLGAQGYTDVVGLAATPSGQGYWLVRANGAVYSFGDAAWHGNAPASGIVGIAATSSGGGYWILGDSGAVYAHGNATWYGNGSACCGFPSSSIVAKRGLHRGYHLINKNSSEFHYNGEDNQVPIGSVDENSYVRVKGWAVDPNTTTRSIEVQIKIDGIERYRQATPLHRGDVNVAYSGISGNHGFDWTVPTWLHDAQPHTVQVWALDSGGGPAALLSQTIWSSPNSAPTASPLTPGEGWFADVPFDLTAVYSDLDGGSGYVEFEIAGIGIFSSAQVANNATATYRPTLSAGTYSWRARGFDGTARSGWSPSRGFTIGNNELILWDEWVGTNGSAWDATKWDTSSAGTIDIDANSGRILVDTSSSRATAQMADTGDSDIVLTYGFSDRNSGSELRVTLRGSGATGSAQLPNGYRLDIDSGSSTVKLRKLVAGTVSTIGSFTYSFNPAQPQQRHRLRFRVEGSTISAKMWPVGTPEPAAWSKQVTNSTITLPGKLQIAHSRAATGTTRTLWIDEATVIALPAGGGCPEVNGDLSPEATGYIDYRLFDFRGCVIPIRNGSVPEGFGKAHILDEDQRKGNHPYDQPAKDRMQTALVNPKYPKTPTFHVYASDPYERYPGEYWTQCLWVDIADYYRYHHKGVITSFLKKGRLGPGPGECDRGY